MTTTTDEMRDMRYATLTSDTIRMWADRIDKEIDDETSSRALRLECMRLAVKWIKGGELGSKDTIDVAIQFEHYVRTGNNPITEKPLDTAKPSA